jgi:hypothetical protein
MPGRRSRASQVERCERPHGDDGSGIAALLEEFRPGIRFPGV